MFRHKHEGHVATLKSRWLLYSSYVLSFLYQPFKRLSAKFGMNEFTSAEHDSYFGLVTLCEEFLYVFQFELIVVFFGLRPKLHLLDNYHVLMLFGLFCPLRLFIFVFAVVHYPAHGRSRLRGDFNEVELLLAS